MRNSSSSLSPLDDLADPTADGQTPSSPGAIDARRAHQLLERAASLAARGDMGAAVLATRQSLALAPTSVEGHLLLARVLERKRDFGGARTAYEKIVQLAPDRADARDNLARLNLYLEQSQGTARQFHFDEGELFAPEADEITTNIAPENGTPIEAAPDEFDSMEMFDQSMLPAIEARLPPSREDAASGETRVETPKSIASPTVESAQPVGERRKNNVPVATERRRRPAAPVPLQPAPLVAAVAAPVATAPIVTAPVVTAPVAARAFDSGFDANASAAPRAIHLPLDLDLPAASNTPLWQQVAARPSFYARTLPVVAVAVLSLGFLSWARGRAVSRIVAPASTEIAQADSSVAPADAGAPAQTTTAPSAVGAVAANPNAAQPGAVAGTDAAGFPISNAPFTFQAPATNNAATPGNALAGNGANSATARASNRNFNAASAPRFGRRVLPLPRAVPSFPGVSLAPAPIPPASVRDIARAGVPQNGGGNIVLPNPSIDLPSAPVPRQRVLPPDDNGLNPAGAPGRGYVRITEGRVGNGVIPVQPGGAARQNENNANDAARNGQTDQAISQLSEAIRADSDNAGFRYQQRATLFLQRGDYGRASDDFQSAISAYQNQINNGDDVAQARRGLNSARSGLSLALAGRRG